MKRFYIYLILAIAAMLVPLQNNAAEWSYDFENIESLIGNRGPREAIDVELNGLNWHFYGVKRNIDDQDWCNGEGSICLNGTLLNSSILAKETPNVTLNTMRSIGVFEFYAAAHDYWKNNQVWWIVQYSTDGSNWITVGDAFKVGVTPEYVGRRINQPSAVVRIVREDYATYDYTSGSGYENKINFDDFRITDYDGTLSPSLSANVTSLDFGELTSGEEKTLSFILTHKNLEDEVILSLGGDDASYFTLLTEQISEGDETEISIKCVGKRKGEYRATFQASTGDIQFNMALTATGKMNEDVLFSGGTGTEGDPYLISDASDLQTLSRMVEYEKQSYEGQYFLVTNDINMKSVGNLRPIGNNWTYEVTSENFTPFRGTFDGGNHTISNLTISGGDHSVAVALFGLTYGATIKNVKLAMSSITGHAAVAGITGYVLNHGVIENCHIGSDVIITANMYGAGIVATNVNLYATPANGITYVRDCTNAARVNDFTAGAAGIICSISTETVVERCGNQGEVTSTNLNVGGICNLVKSQATFIDCYNTGKLFLEDANSQGGTVQTGVRGGGIVASAAEILYTDNMLTIKNCYGNSYMSESSTRLHQIYDADELWGENYDMSNNYYNAGYGNIFEKYATPVDEAVMKTNDFVEMLNQGASGCWMIKDGVNKGFPVPENFLTAISNPATDNQPAIKIENGKVVVAGNYDKVSIYDMNGRQQSLNNIANGMYIIKVEADGKTIVKKIVR